MKSFEKSLRKQFGKLCGPSNKENSLAVVYIHITYIVHNICINRERVNGVGGGYSRFYRILKWSCNYDSSLINFAQLKQRVSLALLCMGVALFLLPLFLSLFFPHFLSLCPA